MNNEIFSKEKKCQEFLHLQYYGKETLIELVDFFILVVKIFN